MSKKSDKNPKEVYTYTPHHFYPDKHAGKQVCAWCGLVALRNPATDWCIEKGCNYALHTSHKAVMLRLTKQFDF